MVAYHLTISKGERLDGKYTVVGKIGSGSYGDVYKVENAEKKVFALKLLRLWEIMGDLHENLLRRFQQEYRVMRISSEYLVHGLDSGEIQGNPYIVMDYCPNGDLSKFVGKDASLIQYYAVDILKGLHALHVNGKVHRDLKPENVLLGKGGRVMLTDFGVVGEMEKAKRMSEVGWWKNKPKQTFGTPLYMSPEIFFKKGGGVTYLPTVDLWSFGVMMYEVVTGGSFPFGNIESVEDFPQYMEKARRGKWNRDALDRVPNGECWKKVISGCLMPDPATRYQSALQIIADMQPMTGYVKDDVPKASHLSRSPIVSRLVISQGENVGRVFSLESCLNGNCRMVHVGRRPDNDIVLADELSSYVSRYHFTLEKSADGQWWTIKDGQWQKSERRWMPSTNGTYLNAQLVSTGGLRLYTGDVITAGEYKMIIE